MAAERPPAGPTTDRRTGHRVDPWTREGDVGVVTTLLPPPGKGAPFFSSPSSSPPLCPQPHLPLGPHWESSHAGGISGGHTGRLPKLHFPSFDGENPKLWITRCEDYFDLYLVPPQLWIRVATMHFSSAAARWLQSVDAKLKSLHWSDFCQLSLSCFGRDEHEALLHQLFHIRQTTTVADYIDRFTGLVDQLTAYVVHLDPIYYTQCFIDGLRDEFRSAILVQRPISFDTACVLA